LTNILSTDNTNAQDLIYPKGNVFTLQDTTIVAKTITLENIAKVYPNPVTNYVNVVIPGQAQKIDAKIYSVEGKLLNQKTIENNERVNIENLKEGMFIMKLYDGKNTYTNKFVKQ